MNTNQHEWLIRETRERRERIKKLSRPFACLARFAVGMILPLLQGLVVFETINPGRCPGLSSVGLAALSIGAAMKAMSLFSFDALLSFNVHLNWPAATVSRLSV